MANFSRFFSSAFLSCSIYITLECLQGSYLSLSFVDLVAAEGNSPEGDIVQSNIEHGDEHVRGHEELSEERMWLPHSPMFAFHIEEVLNLLYSEDECGYRSNSNLDEAPYDTESSVHVHLLLSEEPLVQLFLLRFREALVRHFSVQFNFLGRCFP